MEDVAKAAGVSTATAFNHFPTRHALMGHLYAPFVQAVSEKADAAIAGGADVVELVEHHVRDLAAMARDHQALTVPLIGAVQEYTVRVGGPPSRDDPNDPRVLAPVPDALIGLLQRGQAQGLLRTYPRASEIGVQITNLLLLRSLTRPNETASDTAELMLTLLFGALRPETLVDAGRDGRPFAAVGTRRRVRTRRDGSGQSG